MLLHSGISAGDGLLMLQDDENDKAGKAVLQSILDHMEDGVPLSFAFGKSGYFSRYMVNMIEIGERTGRLVETLEALSEHYDRQERMALTIRNAVFYPAILLIMMMAVVMILIIRVLPIFNDVFSRLGNQITPLAATLMRFGAWFADTSAVFAVILGFIALCALAVWLIEPLRATVTTYVKNVFGGRGIWGRIASSRFVSALALSTASGLDTEEAIAMAASLSGGSRAVDKMHARCLELLRSGSALSEALYQAGILSSRDSRMLSVGSRTGMEDKALVEIAGRSGRNVQNDIDRVVGKVEPVIVITISVIIGVILLSVMLPLMGIMSSIG